MIPLFDFRCWAAEDIADPYPIYRRYREADPVHHGAMNTWYVFRHDDVASVLANDHFGRGGGVSAPSHVPPGQDALREMIGNWLVFMDPPRHGDLRSVLSREFSPDVVSRLRVRVGEIARDLVADLAGERKFDLVEHFAAPLPILVISELLGVPRDHRAWFRDCAVSLQEASSGRAGRQADGYARAEAAARELASYFHLQAHRCRGEDHDGGLIGLLVRAHARGEPLTEQEIVATCVHLLTAGHETTTNLIGKSVLALLGHPGVLDELRADPRLMPDAVHELIRFDSPVQMVTRWCYSDEELRGRQLSRGDKVVLVLGAANRDPLCFSEPDELRLDRGRVRHCGFGLGIHYCLGAALARAEAEIGLATLFETFPRLGLADESVEYAEDMVFHGPARLVLRTR